MLITDLLTFIKVANNSNYLRENNGYNSAGCAKCNSVGNDRFSCLYKSAFDAKSALTAKRLVSHFVSMVYIGAASDVFKP